jgi:hypothetical protein
MSLECGREADVLDALAARRWPDRDPEIAAHVAACPACADLIEVMNAFAADREPAGGAPLPPAEVVWWRTQVRARSEAARVAARPITLVQGAWMAALVGLALALATAGGPAVPRVGAWLSGAFAGWIARVPVGAEMASLVAHAAVASIGVCLALVPIAVLLSSDD